MGVVVEKQPKINTAVEAENSIYFGSFEVYTQGGRVANPETFHRLIWRPHSGAGPDAMHI